MLSTYFYHAFGYSAPVLKALTPTLGSIQVSTLGNKITRVFSNKAKLKIYDKNSPKCYYSITPRYC